ncbi:APG6-domain-containing protein [Fomitiporia mediterranea MF3/22]|uniref:APG6-domain-containing protein n=1 Tax=Fomitiporia mediterranea (strain MF3/22) TaxID=694068 RepID=UPI000440933C|nr:APG6-domain-containing protein [Fomitiporia mediterranea MF3/22]EJD02941.1 APG6-domain-containing protein [Fomitiporia mediterranea MF3/22]
MDYKGLHWYPLLCSSTTMSSSYICRKCKQPIQLDASLADLTPSSYDLLASTLASPPRSHSSDTEKIGQVPSPVSAKNARKRGVNIQTGRVSPTPIVTPSKVLGKQAQRSVASAPNESFVFLQDSVVQKIPSSGVVQPHPANSRTQGQQSPPQPVSPISNKLSSINKLFSLLSSRTDLDHPLCTECTDSLLKALGEQLKDTMRERDGYLAFEKELKKEKQREEESVEEIERRIERLKEEERLAIEDLREAQAEKEQLEEELRALELEEKDLEEDETEFWTAHNTHLLTAAEQASQLASLRAAYAYDSIVLEKLERTNVYNDAFCIGHDGVFGTINGLRLGRVSGVHVEWAEINAAWGQALLLLFTIARKLDYTFESYRLVPTGSFSRIEKTNGDKSSYELYGSGDLHIGRLLHNRRFDFAMVAFLDCLRQLMEYVRFQDQSVEFPHQVVKDKIGDVSIKLQFGVEEAWTRALRHVLLALKLLLKWTTSAAA